MVIARKLRSNATKRHEDFTVGGWGCVQHGAYGAGFRGDVLEVAVDGRMTRGMGGLKHNLKTT